MPISIIDNFDVNAPKNIDGRLGPYDTTVNALSSIDEATQRYLGLTVLITGSGTPTEYWFQDGVTDSDLVLKPIGSAVGFPYSGSDSLNNDPQQALITGSLYLSGSGHITASGDISASGDLSSRRISSSGDFTFRYDGNTIYSEGTGKPSIINKGDYLYFKTGDYFLFYTDYDADGIKGGLKITPYYDSATPYIYFDLDNRMNHFSGSLNVVEYAPGGGGNIKASGNISASGNLFASASDGVGINHVALYNTSSGQFFYTASNAIGGSGGGTDPKYLVYQTGSGTDSIKPAHGNGNVASGTRSTVVGGASNEATQTSTFVGGGEENCALQTKTAVLGGEKNKACQGYSVAGGGFTNTANGCLSGVWSGCLNTAGGNSSAILGGRNNEASGDCSIVGGGSTNSANCTTSGIFSGCTNDVNGNSSAILGGESNQASGDCSIVVGGQLNCAQQTHDFIGGGCNNKTPNSGVSSFNSILGGGLNEILDALGNSTSYSTIGGGECNQIDADHAVIGGGCKNFISGDNLNPEHSTIGGGHNNYISSSASTIAGGEGNHINISSTYSTIGGGHQNKIDTSANINVIGGGTQNNIATGACCGGILGGQRNKLQHDHSFIIGSNLTSSAACTTFMNNATLEGNISSSATGSFGYVVLDYDTMPTSDPNVKGAIYRSGTTILISAG